MRARPLLLLALLTISLLVGVVSAQTYRLGAMVGPGAVIDLPEATTTAGEPVRHGVPTVVLFMQVRDCVRCFGVGDITRTWVERYPNVQMLVASMRTPEQHAQAWGEEFGVSIVYDGVGVFEDAFDTNVPMVYLLDGSGTVRDRFEPQYRQQWLAFDAQVARANAGDWAAVDANSVALPSIGRVARSSVSVAVGDGSPVVVLIGDGYCAFCEDLVSGGLQDELNGLTGSWPGLRVYVLEPSHDSIAAGFYGTPLHDYGPRSVFEEFVATFGADAAGSEIVNFLETGKRVYPLPDLVWPDTGWADGVTLIRYETFGPDDPVIAWGYAEKEMPGMLVFDAEGRYLGPTPYFLEDTASDLVATVRELLAER